MAGKSLPCQANRTAVAAGVDREFLYVMCLCVHTAKGDAVPVTRQVRYAVVGLGHIAQVAVLPAFAHARRNSQLVAVVSDDRTKRREIAKRYRLDWAFTTTN